MIWQDILITTINILFSYALIPQVLQGFKDKKKHITIQTGLINTVGLYVLSIAFFSLGLFFSTIVGIISATLWLILFIQSVTYNKN